MDPYGSYKQRWFGGLGAYLDCDSNRGEWSCRWGKHRLQAGLGLEFRVLLGLNLGL